MELVLSNISVLMYYKGERFILCIIIESFEYNVIKIYGMNIIYIISYYVIDKKYMFNKYYWKKG